MEWTPAYILSQIFTVLMYILLATTYFLRNRKSILIASILSNSAMGIAYALLNAWTGVAMCIVAIVRESIFLLDEKRNGKRENIIKKDVILLMFFFLIIAISAIFTYDGFFSLLSVFATMLYTYSVWQKKVSTYKLCGILVGIFWIAYNIYVMTLFGIILESILLILSTTGYILERKKQKHIEV